MTALPPTSQTPLLAVPGRGVLVIGAGGLSCPALTVLVKSGLRRLTLVDDDVVDASNLQRQTLYDEGDVGRLKVEVAAEKLAALAADGGLRCETVVDRFTPDTARALIADHALVLEGGDNFATKFLTADAARLAGVPVVQAGAVRFSGWALASLAGQSACLRCVFEDIPRGQAETCAASGVLGPVVGVLGALEAWLALELLSGRRGAAGQLIHYDALAGRLRKHGLARRNDCALCQGQIRDLDPARYSGACAA